MKSTLKIKKETPNQYPIKEGIENRWSPRVFAEKPITDEQVKTLLEAGRWASSASNIQPWRVIWGIKGTETYDRIYNCLDDFNKSWANNAPLLWINAFKKTTKGDKENVHALHDLGLFMGNVANQAQSMGIALHQMAGVQFKKAKEEFEFPDDYHVATAVAIGYYGGDPKILPEDLREQEVQKLRERKKQETFAFNGNFSEKQ